jgi:hypothetical protein
MLLFLLIALCFGMTACVWLIVRRKRMIWRILGGIGASVFLLVGGLASVLLLFTTAMCGHYDFPSAISPDGKKIAQLREADCGAIDSFHSQVQVKPSGFLFGVRTGEVVFTTGDDPRLLDLQWVGSHELYIRYPSDPYNPEEFSCQEHWKDVKITCISFPREFSKPAKMPPLVRGFW